jgi:hypothetical protein
MADHARILDQYDWATSLQAENLFTALSMFRDLNP